MNSARVVSLSERSLDLEHYVPGGNQIWIYVINLPRFSALPGFKAPFHGDGQSALNPGTTVSLKIHKQQPTHC